MNPKNNKSATIIELIIASFVAIIVLSSIAVIDFSVRMMHRNVSPNTLLATETMSIFNHISRNLLLASGNAFEGNGIILNGATAISIRQDPNLTPNDFTDDQWFYYQLSDNNIEFCGGQGSCVTSISNLGSGKIFNFNLELLQSSVSGSLQNELTVRIGSCLDVDTCGSPDFKSETIISLPSHGGPSI